MLFKQHSVQFNQISADHTFRISTESDIRGLVDSLRCAGLINLPILKDSGGSFQVISGFRRIRAARELGWEHLPVRVVSPENTKKNNSLIAIIDNSAQRNLNVIEQARAIHLLSPEVSEPTELVTLARAAGMAVNLDMIRKLEAVIQMPVTFHTGLINGSICLPVALKLFRMIESEPGPENGSISGSTPGNPSGAGPLALAELLLELNLSLNRQRELIDWVEAITHREAVSINRLLAEQPIVTLRSEQPCDRSLKSRKIRDYLKTRRYPEISSVQDRFNHTLKALALPPQLRLVPPPYLEGQTFSLQVNFKSQQELKSLNTEISRISTSCLFEHLLDPTGDQDLGQGSKQ